MNNFSLIAGLRQIADFLDSFEKAKTPLPLLTDNHSILVFFYNAKEFIRAVAMLGSCTKEWGNQDLVICKRFSGLSLKLYINKELLGCTKTVKWSCPNISILDRIPSTDEEKTPLTPLNPDFELAKSGTS